MSSVSLLAFSGSVRKDSVNKRVLFSAIKLAEEQDIAVEYLDLKELALPLYDGDLEKDSGLPANARIIKEKMKAHAGFLIACPEYNGSITPLFKNTIDWASRQTEGEVPLECFKDKVITLISASPGQLGGLRGLVHARSILGSVGALVLPGQLAFGNAGAAVTEEGKLADQKKEEALKNLLQKQISIMTRLAQ